MLSQIKTFLMAALILADKNLRNKTETNESVSQEASDLNEIVLWLEKLNLKFKNIERLIDNS